MGSQNRHWTKTFSRQATGHLTLLLGFEISKKGKARTYKATEAFAGACLGVELLIYKEGSWGRSFGSVRSQSCIDSCYNI